MQPHTYNTIQVKKMNVELVKNTLKAQGVGTKASIAQLTKLSVATCGTILNELVASNEVIEMETEGASGGRPAKQYKYNADFGCVICLLIKTEGGILSIHTSCVNLIGETLNEAVHVLERIDMDVIDQQIEILMSENSNVQAIGIGIPGIVHRGVIGVCDVPELVNQPLGPFLENKYELSITIENDMNMTVYGFYHMFNFEEDKTFAVVTFPRNHFPGAGFIVDGRILSGNTKFGGEVSFLPFGVSREEQLRLLHTEEGFVQLASHTLTSVIAIINPVTIAITGDLPQESQLDDLYQYCLKDIPEAHMPQLIVKNDTNREYMTGLATATLESLTYRLQIIEKR
ncbi:ROK family protein [Paenibacillus cellulosilyticus]|uniref:ROK family protein n=1 Tax=Paenibacillus cellulosilyticus TaxID=375489 RepID=A0A2V2YTP8_9BACL|nr:ROK family protein [Paenibacillus cellulosilyticus]PWW02939.1 ROK family protein [Paenibacillus cellulosilyticus]QKS45845.1 ROK family protein [Paenibacillus cellulosilyticus]